MNLRTALGSLALGAIGALTIAAVTPQDEAAYRPGPSPEHRLLASFAGEWEVEQSMMGSPPSKGTEVSRLVCDGMWLLGEYKADFMGMPFEGHSIMGYDPAKGKYVSVWVDSMEPKLSVSESDWDPETRTLTGVDEMDMGFGPQKVEMTSVLSEDGNGIVFTMAEQGKDGPAFMTINYSRKK